MTLAAFFKVYSDIENKQKLMSSDEFASLQDQLKKVQEAIETKKEAAIAAVELAKQQSSSQVAVVAAPATAAAPAVNVKQSAEYRNLHEIAMKQRAKLQEFKTAYEALKLKNQELESKK